MTPSMTDDEIRAVARVAEKWTGLRSTIVVRAEVVGALCDAALRARAALAALVTEGAE